jgi:hypothetical protein
MIISPGQAMEYFGLPCQRRASMLGGDLPVDGVEYWAKGPVCGAFHDAPWPGVIMGHFAVKPYAKGFAEEPARCILRAIWAHHNPARIVGWMKESNRAGLAFVRRLGFEIDGRMPMAQPVVMMGWAG